MRAGYTPLVVSPPEGGRKKEYHACKGVGIYVKMKRLKSQWPVVFGEGKVKKWRKNEKICFVSISFRNVG